MATTAIAGEAVKIVEAHHITCTQAYRMDETGQRYSWEPWSGDDRYYQGDSAPVDMAIPASAELAENRIGGIMMYWQGHGYTCQEAVDAHLAVPQK